MRKIRRQIKIVTKIVAGCEIRHPMVFRDADLTPLDFKGGDVVLLHTLEHLAYQGAAVFFLVGLDHSVFGIHGIVPFKGVEFCQVKLMPNCSGGKKADCG